MYIYYRTARDKERAGPGRGELVSGNQGRPILGQK
jgi:hypothetical protein